MKKLLCSACCLSATLVFTPLGALLAQETDSVKTIPLNEVVVSTSQQKNIDHNTTQTVRWVDKKFMNEHLTGNLMQTLKYVPGIHSMDIGSGFSKPMIRGMGFSRIAVTENGIKQEGQQWGADHGLEIDAFNVERVLIRKGPASLLYGSDAMGGVIEILPLPAPASNQLYGEVSLLGKSVNGTLAASVLLGLKRNAWHAKLRFSEQHFGDLRIPADTIVYLTQRMPVDGGSLKNTAGFERDVALLAEYRKGENYSASYAVSNAFQQVGFFPGAHGIPDISRLQNDGDSRNIDLPYSTVNHLKLSTRQQYVWDSFRLRWDLGAQHNFREEWSLFHTHYGTQPVPENDPNKELEFSLATLSSSLKFEWAGAGWKHTVGWDLQHQRNHIAGYSFLLPEYERTIAGGSVVSVYQPSKSVAVSGGLRFDYGKMDIAASKDSYLEEYLRSRAYTEDFIEKYSWRSYAVNRNFGDVSASLGLSWQANETHLLKANIGRSFRLPGANELASNGVHHGAFRHEQGDASLSSERGWQIDAAYTCEHERMRLAVSPFFSWFGSYIYLKPTGEWSVLPHAGQIYRYTSAAAIFTGAELELRVDLLRNLSYQLAGEYVYTHNLDERTPMSFSPPASMRNSLVWTVKMLQLHAELESIAPQNRVAKNEDRTRGANLVNLGATTQLHLAEIAIELALSVHNLLNTSYHNHLSFYRKVEIPEPGRNIQLSIKIPLKIKTK